ncbi:hypothetical protein TSUD_414770 [Trifolium subterraneum]|uniref:Ubiquitin-like protease family profile domain-containing protein n=1 Tax=Trifolium subterraneum TaxID=3900 RepID=A0A2Z6P769_TRISU|nr:hypothetical protein TSUD_414770 [Trifolium subterraneum]
MKKTPKKGSKPENDSTKNKCKRQNEVGTHSLHVTQQISETHNKKKRTEIHILSSSSNPTDTTNGKDNKQDNDSTGSTPDVKRRNLSRRLPLPDRKTRKWSYLVESMRVVALGPPKSKLKGTTKDAEFMEVSKDHSSSKHNKDDEQDNDSTGSSPIGKRRNFSRRLPVTERKTRKSDNYLETLRASASVPAKSKLKGTAGKLGKIFSVDQMKKMIVTYTSITIQLPLLDMKIINIVVARQNWFMKTIGRPNSVWYMPTEFAQYALEAHKDADDVRQIYQAKYMTPAEHVSRMFIPMNDQGNHWYLMVVDFVKKKLVWLDSLRCATRDHPRRRGILRMAIFVEEILMYESYGTDVPAFNQERMVSAFSLYQPRHIQQQRPGSNDCGVWISKWMIECPLRSEYGYITVNTATRMKLAIHLVKAANNELYNDVLAKAAKNWTVEEKKRNKLVKL